MSKKPKRSRLQKLQHSWEKASPLEREDFLGWLQAPGVGVSELQANALTRSEAPIASGRYLTSSTITRIKTKMAARGMSADDVMNALGFATDGIALRRALENNASLRLVVVTALAEWLSG